MRVTFLGGTDIGASCLWFETQTGGWLVDAGVRMDDRDPLPSLDRLARAGDRVQGIFVTHAHQDHIGALPLISSLFPEAPVFMTRATLDLARVMLADALKVGREEGKVSVFTEDQLNDLWPRVRVMGQDKVFGWNGMQVATYSAGHILGAVSIGFVTETEGSVLVTGDFSVTPGRLLPGLRMPRGSAYDAVITESTYGNRLHGNRAEQENRMARQVAEVIQRGGFVLIPAFAVGRAQEVLTILQDFMRYNKDDPKFPLVVDGLVRSVCPVYEAHGELLRGPAKRMLRTTGSLFDREDIRFVRRPEERRDVVEGRPACIIASSGMLNGGPSVFYADKLIQHENNAILLCGYQDEESPGRRLLDMAEQPEAERRWILPDRVVPVNAKVALYSLSAHADRRELVQTAAQLRPRQVLLVHGDPEAKEMLAAELRAYLPKAEIRAAGLGETVEILPGERRHRFTPADVSEEERPVRAHSWTGQVLVFRTPGQAGELAIGVCASVTSSACVVTTAAGTALRVPVGLVVDALGRVPAGEHPEEYLAGLWRAAQACVEENRVWGYRPAERLGYRLAEEWGRLVPADPLGLEAVSEALAPYGWRKVEPDEQSRVFRLYVAFPWAVPEEVRETVNAREIQGGWRYELQPHVYPPAVQRLAEETARSVGGKAGNVRIYPQERRVEVPVAGGLTVEQRLRMEDSLRQRVGGTVRVVPVDLNLREAAGTAERRMEQNAALAAVREQAPAWLELQKAGLDPALGTITLSVAFPDAVRKRPEVAAFAERVERLTGWRVAWADSVNQQRLSEAAVELCRGEGLEVRKNPSLMLADKVVRVQVSGAVEPEQGRAVAERFRERTGWTLELAGPSRSMGTGSGEEETVRRSCESGRERMEMNRALSWVEASAKAHGIAVYKKSVQGESLELMFITPEAGRKHRDWLEQMAEETGWALRVANKIHQQALIQLAQELAGDCGLLRTPGIHQDRREVRVRTERPVPEE
ncbi:MAG: MBL fold metallo-hydrolase, partial [Kyrpidia tusciae]